MRDITRVECLAALHHVYAGKGPEYGLVYEALVGHIQRLLPDVWRRSIEVELRALGIPWSGRMRRGRVGIGEVSLSVFRLEDRKALEEALDSARESARVGERSKP